MTETDTKIFDSMENIVSENFNEMEKILHEFNTAENLVKVELAGKIMSDGIGNGGQIISCGNGGSLSDAMHFAEELTGRFRKNRRAIPATAICDPTFITCVANDFGYDRIHSRWVEAYGKENDVLLAISTSGKSENVINGAIAAREKGMKIIALTGKGGGPLSDLCDVEIRAPYSAYSDRVQEIHIKVIHTLCQLVEANLGLEGE